MASRRPPYANSTSPPPSSGESPFGRQSTVSPVLKSHSWHQTSQPGAHPARRISRPSSHHEFTFSTPDGHRDSLSRKKSRGADGFADSPAAATPHDADADDGPTKGGHSLRKRARVNYASEQIEDEVTVPNSSSASRQRRRRADGNLDDSSEDLYGPRPKRRGASLGIETPSSRRRNPSRKSAESRAYVEDFDDDDHVIHRGAIEDEIHDTIQVGNWSSASSSPSSRSDSRESVTNTFASPEHDPALKTQLYAYQSTETPSKAVDANNDNVATAPTQTVEPVKDEIQDATADPGQQLQVESMESQQHVEETPVDKSVDQVVDPAPPAVSPRSPVRASKSPPRTPSRQQESAPIKQSPEPNQEGSPMAVDSRVPETEAAEEPRPSTLLPVGPKPLSREQPAAGQDNTASSNKQPGFLKSPPKDSVEDSAMAKSPVNEDKDKDKEQPVSVKEGSVANSLEPTKADEVPETEAETPVPEVIEPEEPVKEPVLGTPLKEELSADKPTPPLDPRWCRPQPTPVGRWSHLTPYVDGHYSVYPEKKVRSEEDDGSEDQSPEDKDSNKESNDVDAVADDNDDGPEGMATELPTPALNTPTRGSPVPEAIELTGLNSPVPVVEEPEDPDVSEPPEPLERKKHYRYRKLRDPEEFAAAIENYEDMSTTDLYDALQAINLSLVGWQDEWTTLGKIVDDYENASRRRIADAKYETRTRNLNQHGINFEEPEFLVRGYRGKEKETMSETRYLQAQDRIMAATYGFEYDPHPSKIGRQNPETQQAGITTRGRSLRNQPRQTAKATEADGVTGKRQRKPVQLFDPAPQDASRASTPVPTRGRRRKNANADIDDIPQPSFTSSFNDNSDGEAPTGPGRRKRGPKPRAARIAGDFAPANYATQEDGVKASRRRGRPRAAVKDEETGPSQRTVDMEPRSGPQQKRRHLLTLKIPKGRNLSEPSSAISDNGDSRPSTASSDSTTHTAESSYSFRPKRQKRFRDEPDDNGSTPQGPPKKRSRRVGPAEDGDTMMTAAEPVTPAASQSNGSNRKGPKIKVMRPSTGPAADSRNGTPMSQPAAEGTEERPKEYRAMTKSEKMSASMKSKFLANLSDTYDAMLTRIKADGPTVTWLAPWRSERPRSQQRRPPRQRPSSELASSLPSPRVSRARRRRRRYLERTQRLYTTTRRLIPISTLIPTRILIHHHLLLLLTRCILTFTSHTLILITPIPTLSTLTTLTMSILAWALRSIRPSRMMLFSKTAPANGHITRPDLGDFEFNTRSDFKRKQLRPSVYSANTQPEIQTHLYQHHPSLYQQT